MSVKVLETIIKNSLEIKLVISANNNYIIELRDRFNKKLLQKRVFQNYNAASQYVDSYKKQTTYY